MCCSGTRFSGRLGSARLTVGRGDASRPRFNLILWCYRYTAPFSQPHSFLQARAPGCSRADRHMHSSRPRALSLLPPLLARKQPVAQMRAWFCRGAEGRLPSLPSISTKRFKSYWVWAWEGWRNSGGNSEQMGASWHSAVRQPGHRGSPGALHRAVVLPLRMQGRVWSRLLYLAKITHLSMYTTGITSILALPLIHQCKCKLSVSVSTWKGYKISKQS